DSHDTPAGREVKQIRNASRAGVPGSRLFHWQALTSREYAAPGVIGRGVGQQLRGVDMRYRVSGRGVLTQEPRESCILEAETEEAARAQASARGMTIEEIAPEVGCEDSIHDLERDDGWIGCSCFVPTPMAVVDKMLDAARVTKDDVLYDLGCGDGRIV